MSGPSKAPGAPPSPFGENGGFVDGGPAGRVTVSPTKDGIEITCQTAAGAVAVLLTPKQAADIGTGLLDYAGGTQGVSPWPHSGIFDEHGVETPTRDEYVASGYAADGYDSFMARRAKATAKHQTK